MTQEEILKYNKRCAEFLGYELITPQMRKRPEQWNDNSYWEHKDKANVHTSKKVLGRDGYLEFHSDWNWIMNVVETIEKLGYEIDIFSNCVEICDTPDENYITEAVGKTKKEAVVQAIYEFLKFYNLNN
jgi:tRNA G46 methylase TrmB